MALDLNISKQILQATVVSIIPLTSVDPDPDSGCEKIRSGSGVNFDTDPDPAIFLYGSGSREIIQIPRIRIRHTATNNFENTVPYGNILKT